MIRQPNFLTKELATRFVEQVKKKKNNPYLEHIRYDCVEEGLSCQMMHLGSFDDEPISFEKMEKYCTNQGFLRTSKIHREIYLSDPRRTETSKLKTVLRFPVQMKS